jgi:hypothetical protein
MVGVVLAFFLYKLLKKAFLDYQAGRDRNYNVFDKAELSLVEKQILRRWMFNIPTAL